MKMQKIKIQEMTDDREARKIAIEAAKPVDDGAETQSQLNLVMTMVCNIVKDSKLSYNPLSSMVNRNVKFFERAKARNKAKPEPDVEMYIKDHLNDF
jgi:hypothetical protein